MENLTRDEKLKALALALGLLKKAPETAQFYLYITEEKDDPVQLDFAPLDEFQYDRLAILVGKRRMGPERKERVHVPLKGLRVTIYGTDGPFVKPGECKLPITKNQWSVEEDERVKYHPEYAIDDEDGDCDPDDYDCEGDFSGPMGPLSDNARDLIDKITEGDPPDDNELEGAM